MRPDDPTLRVARGMFLYGRDEAEAVCDVQRAVAVGAFGLAESELILTGVS